MRKKLAFAAPVVVALALGATACGGDDTKAQNAWAKKVCGDVKPQIVASETARLDLDRVVKGESPEALQKRLSGDLGKLAAANSGLATAIDGAGTPKVDNGAKIRKDSVGELRSTGEGFTSLQKQVDGLSTKDQAKFSKGLEGVAVKADTLSKNSDRALAKLTKGDLGAAMARQPGCKKVDAGAVPKPATASPSEKASASPSPSHSGKPGKASPSPSHSGKASASPSTKH